MNNEKFYKLTDKIKIALFASLVAVLFVIGLLFFLRPTVSDTEKRELTKFPSFTVESFLSGEWTSQVSLWFADTYPLREMMIGANYSIEELYGIRDEVIKEDAYVANDTAYQYYAFDKNQSDRYISNINQFAESVKGKATVYNMIVPLHYQVSPKREELMAKNPKASDGKASIDYMYSKLSSNVSSVDAYSEMLSHNDEYLYYRTDHHWTARGAYYAYVAFCEEKGITPTPLSAYRRLQFDGFLGTLYAEHGQPQDMKNNPDYVEAFVPIGINEETVYDSNGNKTVELAIVYTGADKYSAGNKYLAFIGGDQPLIEIHNPNITDGSSIVIIKESYGNAFVPFLVDSYEHVYVIDYRKWSGSLADFVTERGIDDVLFLNVINATSTKARIDEMSEILK